MHWLSPQVAGTALAAGITTLVIQDFGPVWNLGCNPAEGLAATWAALEAVPVNAALLVRGSSVDPGPVEAALRAGGAGLKIHEDVGAGAPQIATALDLCDAHDVQLAVHTDGLNRRSGCRTRSPPSPDEPSTRSTSRAPGAAMLNLLDLAGEPNVLASSTSPTVPFWPGAAAEHFEMVAAVHVLDPIAARGTRGPPS